MPNLTDGQYVQLQPGKERSLAGRHPWIFSGAIQANPMGVVPGQTVLVKSADGRCLGSGSFCQVSQIRVRMWSFNPEEEVNRDFIYQRVSESVQRRNVLRDTANTNSFRLIHSESDELPGVILDLFGDTAVLQLLTSGAQFWREEIISCILEFLRPACLIEKSEGEVLKLEGLEPRQEVLHGTLPVDGVVVKEGGLQYKFDIFGNQKTGFYLDQRENRELIRRFAQGKKVLDCFSFTGGFSMNCLAAGADHVIAVDSSMPALSALQQNVRINSLDDKRIETVETNAFEYLRKLRDRAETFDLIVLDPPKFAPTRAQAERAGRAYKDINLLALKLLKPGGILFTFSCSGGVNLDLFKKIVADAALDAGRPVQYLHTMHQASDHPVLCSFPEGEYLKGLVCMAMK